MSLLDAIPHDAPHIPVLLDEVIAALAPAEGKVIVDCTLGAGGYTRALLDAGATVHAFDRDPDAIAAAQVWGQPYGDRLILHPRRFSEIAAALAEAGVGPVDGIVADIGVSSMQLDQRERGFAFGSDGPLDMRMSQEGPSAADFCNTAEDEVIANVLFTYGEERQSRRVARAIVAARPLETTAQLAGVIRRALGHKPGMPKDPATRSFQAIRIHVNDELGELEGLLAASEGLLAAGGRLAVVSFHSLEDRIVKQFLKDASGAKAAVSRYVPVTPAAAPAAFEQISKAIRAGEAELSRNPRARSATLRYATRTHAAANIRSAS
ncbi:16S rRNA (cytosine(1402)-N(4))-methyltransferase RsmH [Novosphingobium umbonatum]|uniref:Ribosomal RNA small subunit methyltransferase H n=1 Tax=Novosphingobium umbonatum TaxID=1908524 RepID=A0A437NCI8_9SPHN|nr:16S rRNA (cytosine(1402)-N(4))-methyltransferase RsmH [Novosphingobium umbonatum]RVU07617.1 16S rRNA (cytosine(1402)-N(4))-methyltransferase RsmH [Novosphingobium umbonatum]